MTLIKRNVPHLKLAALSSMMMGLIPAGDSLSGMMRISGRVIFSGMLSGMVSGVPSAELRSLTCMCRFSALSEILMGCERARWCMPRTGSDLLSLVPVAMARSRFEMD